METLFCWKYKDLYHLSKSYILSSWIFTGLPGKPSHKFGFRSSVQKNGLSGEGRHEGLVPRNDVLTSGFIFRAEKRNEHAWTFLPRSPGRVWKNGGISNILLPKNKMFPLTTWKEQAICLQKLQAVVITLSLLNFLEEYLMVKRTLTTLISLRCTGNVRA